MARPPKTLPVIDTTDANINQKAIGDAMSTMRSEATALAVSNNEQNQRVTALAKQLNYKGSIDPAVLENSAADAYKRMNMTIFEFGAYLLMLKEACPHGTFYPTLERIGCGVDAARRYMTVTRRFANPATSRDFEAIGMSKLAELLPLDDDQLEDLTNLGQTGELALDDVARMSVKELRASVRKERQEKERLKKVTTELNDEVIQLKLDKKVVALTDWPDALLPLSDQIAAAGRKIAQGLSELETCRITLFAAGVDLGDEERARFEAALGHVADVYQEALSRAERSIEKERLTFDQTLGNFGEGEAA